MDIGLTIGTHEQRITSAAFGVPLWMRNVTAGEIVFNLLYHYATTLICLLRYREKKLFKLEFVHCEHLNEVNIMSFGYGEKICAKSDSIIELENGNLFAGPITKSGSAFAHDGFIDIVKIGAPPPKEQIWKSLFNKTPVGVWGW